MRASFAPSCILLTAVLTLFACEGDTPTANNSSPQSPGSAEGVPRLRTAADTAAFLKSRVRIKANPVVAFSQGAIPGACRSGAGTGVNGAIELCPGDTLTLTVTFAECSGIGDTMRVNGPIDYVISTDACHDVGATHTEVATTAGNVTWTQVNLQYGTGSWRLSGTYPDLVVEMEEGFGDLDYDDNVISVHIGRRPCPPTGNPILDDPTNREKFDSSWKASNPRAPQAERREHLRAGYQYPDGHVVSQDMNPPTATNCGVPNYRPPLVTTDGGRLLWIWHSHPFVPGELASVCGTTDPLMQKPYPAVPSSEDWALLDGTNESLNNAGLPLIDGYIWDDEQVMWMHHNPVSGTRVDSSQMFDRSSCQH